MHDKCAIYEYAFLNSISLHIIHECREIKKKEIKIRLSQSDKRILICLYRKDFHPSRKLHDNYSVDLLDEI